MMNEKQVEAAQQQEPVAMMTVLHLKDRTEIGYGPALAGYDLPTGEYKLYTSPPIEATPLASQRSVKPWVGLTEEERLALAMHENFGSVTDYAEAIEAKLREKNAQPSKPLTDEQIIEMYNEPRSDAEMLEFARAIEAAHGIMSVPDGKGDA